MPDEVHYLNQSVDYLGFLQTELRGLRGLATLIYELVQNADDVQTEEGKPGATLIRLDVRDDALIVENDGVFRLRDFERIQIIASGGKREEQETTGAFGIGLISVYQVTDAPEIFSSGQHWRIRPDATENQIEVRAAQVTGTRFRLPWADNPSSPVRQKLRLEAVDLIQLDEYAQSIGQSLSLAALFLHQLRELEVCRNGKSIRRIVRAPMENNQLLLQDNKTMTVWTFLHGSFNKPADELRRRYPTQIEAKRRSQVQIALSDGEVEGRLFAVLPTEARVPFPFHINADFYPTPDRKRVIFGNDYQAEWNMAAIHAAANALDVNFDDLPKQLGHIRLWDLIEQLGVNRTHPQFGVFWDSLSVTWGNRKIVFTAANDWRVPKNVRYPDAKAEQNATAVLQALDIPLVHPDLRPRRNLMVEDNNQIGLPILGIEDVVAVLKRAGLTQPTPLEKMPPVLQTVENWRLLWEAIDSLTQPRANRSDIVKLTANLQECAIAPNTVAAWCPPQDVFRGDEKTRTLFPSVNWLRTSENDHPLFVKLTPVFGPTEAIIHLEALSTQLESDWRAGQFSPTPLYEWFLLHKPQWINNDLLKRRLRALPIWPAGGGLRSLEARYIPGGFEDPLQIDCLLDMSAFQGKTDLLTELGVQKLDFATYGREELPKVFKRHPELPEERRQELVKVLAQQLSALENDPSLCSLLGGLPLIQCDDKVFRPAAEIYSSPNVRSILGDSIHVATQDGLPTMQRLVSLLGGRPVPRPADVIQCVKTTTAQTPTPAALAIIRAVFEFLVEHWMNFEERTRQDYTPLKTFAWLPSEAGSVWHRPEKIYTTDQKHLFETQGTFLEFPKPLQTRASTVKLIEFLGVLTAPSLVLVIRHLMKCSAENIPVNTAVYRTLNDKSSEIEIHQLIGERCLLLSDGNYVTPQQVFWREHPLHPFRHQLSPDWRQYNALCLVLGVRETPEANDCIAVLQDLAEQFGEHKLPLDETAYHVLLHCWQQLSAVLQDERFNLAALDPLRQKRVIPNRNRMLTFPDRIFFEDRPGLAAKFGQFLADNVIDRPQGAWPAMQMVGVKFLLGQKVVEIKLAELENESSDDNLQARLIERLPLAARVVETDSEAQKVDNLRALRFTRVDRLEIQYATNVFNQQMTTPPEAVPAWRLEDELLVCYTDQQVQWAAIARELAFVLKPLGEIGGLASGLRDALEPKSLIDAEQTLDALGYPRLSISANVMSTPDSQLMGVGGIEPQAEGRDNAIQNALSVADTTSQNPPVSNLTPILDPSSPQALLDQSGEPETPIKATASAKAQSATQPVGGSGNVHKPTSSQSRGKLRTYVISDEKMRSDEPPDTVAARRRSEIDLAGVGRVLAYERLHGRDPEEQDHFNQGYDVVSRMEDSSVLYIEVKSLSGAWSERNAAGLTNAQFDLALKEMDSYWLYVVEFALDHTQFKISRIRNPARRVTQFLFDDGWRDLAETEQ